jgi:hypothetical protein
MAQHRSGRWRILKILTDAGYCLLDQETQGLSAARNAGISLAAWAPMLKRNPPPTADRFGLFEDGNSFTGAGQQGGGGKPAYTSTNNCYI